VRSPDKSLKLRRFHHDDSLARKMDAVSCPPTGKRNGLPRVDVRLTNNREIKDTVVFNAEEIELPNDCAHSEIEDIQLHR
jgi:hypothetical protein